MYYYAQEEEIEELRAAEAALQAKLYRLRLEYDILEKASEVLKKPRASICQQ